MMMMMCVRVCECACVCVCVCIIQHIDEATHMRAGFLYVIAADKRDDEYDDIVPIEDLQLFHPRNLTHITHITHVIYVCMCMCMYMYPHTCVQGSCM